MARAIWRTGKIALKVMVLIVLVALCIYGWKTVKVADAQVARVALPATQPVQPMNEARIVQELNKTEIVSARDKNTRLWQVERYQTRIDSVTGEPNRVKISSLIREKGCGICYQDAEGKWQPVDTSWRQTPDGFIMDKANYRLAIGHTANSTLSYLVDGKELKLKATSIAVDDGSNVFDIAQVANVHGQINSENPRKLVFANAFGAGIDLEIEAQTDGYHQNVIIANKSALAGRINSAKAKILLYTELYSDDDTSSSGKLKIQIEKNPSELNENKSPKSELVAFKNITETRPSKRDIRFAIERDNKVYTSHRFVKSQILQAKTGKNRLELAVADKQLVRDGQSGKTYLIESIDASALDNASYPVTWDYHNVSGWITSDEDWYADSTYYVSSNLTLDSDVTLRIEPGAVINFAVDAYNVVGLFADLGTLIAKGEPYSYIVFTSAEENGEYGPQDDDWYGITVNQSSQIEFCKIGYSEGGIYANCFHPGGMDIKNNIIYHSLWGGITVDVEDTGSGNFNIFNNLIIKARRPIDCILQVSDANVAVQNNTIVAAEHVDPWYGISYNGSASAANTGTIRNNLICGYPTGITGYQDLIAVENYNAFYDCDVMTDGFDPGANDIELTVPPFETEITYLGSYFLNRYENGGELLKDAGDAAVGQHYADPNKWSIYHLPDDGEHYFPMATTLNTNTVWQPDLATCDTGTVAIGYHHPRVDYLVRANLTVNNGANLTIKPGTVVALQNSLTVSSGSRFICDGDLSPAGGYINLLNSPLASAEWLNYWSNDAVYGYNPVTINSSSAAQSSLSFTKCSGLYNFTILGSNFNSVIHDNTFKWGYQALIGQCTTPVKLTNNLFLENFTGIQFHVNCTVNVENCTFDRNGFIGAEITSTGQSTVKNCIFTNTTGAWGLPGNGLYRQTATTVTEKYNLFFDNTYHYKAQSVTLNLDSTDFAGQPTRANSAQIDANTLYQDWNGFGDRFYLPQNSAAVNAGDPYAPPMPGYTTDPNLVLIDTNRRDIGYHYPLPIDSDGDGLYDYQEYWLGTNPNSVDTDGDGLVDGYGGVVPVSAVLNGIDDGTGHAVSELAIGTDPTKADSDGDGMPDGWEVAHNLSPLVNDANSDKDNDGYTNLQEFLHNSNANDYNSLPTAMVLLVPQQFPSIQQAINVSIDGDVIRVSPGIYNEHVNYQGKTITLRGCDPNNWQTVAATVVDGNDYWATVDMSYEDFGNGRVEGLTIRNGQIGVGLGDEGSPVVNRCILENNVTGAGAGWGAPILTNNIIRNNTWGGFSQSSYGSGLVQNNIIYNSQWGMFLGSTVATNNTIVNTDIGIQGDSYASPVIKNCIFWDNDDDLRDCSATYSRTNESGTGNIVSDPLFRDEPNDDYHLEPNSPCINAGDPNTTGIGETDIDGQPRVQAGRVDMGADEVNGIRVHLLEGAWYDSINSAITDANNGDVIEVLLGVYYENIDYQGKSITIRSTDPNNWQTVAATIIDGNSSGNVVQFTDHGWEPVYALEGVTIKNSGATSFGIFIDGDSRPLIRRCIIENNHTGIRCEFSGPTITNNIVRNNSGSGLWIGGDAGPTIKNNLIHNNYRGMECEWMADVANNTIVKNQHGGVISYYGSEDEVLTIKNCIVWDNNDDLSGCFAVYSCISDVNDIGDEEITHNISSSDPAFMPDPNQDQGLSYRLLWNSACIDAGDPCGNYTGQTDIDGEARIWGGGVDIGADEYTDSDNDGMPDIWETAHSLNPALNDANGDTDSDGASNISEYQFGLNPANADTDGDGLNDGLELTRGTDPKNTDSDSDGMPDGWEVEHNLNPLANDGNADADGDGSTNLQEYQRGTDPDMADTDGDGMPDGWEMAHNLTPLANDAGADPDGDSLTNLQEYQHGTDPHMADTDGDGMPDGWEIVHNLNPLVNDAAADTDGDGLTNLAEHIAGTDPIKQDTDSDGISDGYEVAKGLNPLMNDANGDKDNDGSSNLREFLHNSDANDSNSLPFAAILLVPQQISSIQTAINLSIDGDTIIVSPGRYVESINFTGKAITVRSTKPTDWKIVDDTVIDADGAEAVVYFSSGESQSSVLDGLNLQGASSAGILSSADANPKIIHNKITLNNLGIYCESSAPEIKNNYIVENLDGIYLDESAPRIISNLIVSNGDYGISGSGTGIVIDSANISPIIHNNTIADNLAYGIVYYGGALPDIRNCILWNNNNQNLYGCIAHYSCVQDGEDPNLSNISSDPIFLDDSSYRLSRLSPCIDSGDPASMYALEKDIEGQPRQARRIDMGADEVCEIYNATKNIWYRNIQTAINDTNAVDILTVYPWIYKENIDLSNRRITLQSAEPNNWSITEKTIISANDVSIPVIRCAGDGNTVVAGLTVRDADNSSGVYCTNNSNPLFRMCWITRNLTGITCDAGSSPSITQNKIINNYSSSGEGSGIISNSTNPPSILANYIADNDKGIIIANASTPARIYNNTIVHNYDDAGTGVGIRLVSGVQPSIANCIIWENGDDLDNCAAVYSCISNSTDASGEGNISLDPHLGGFAYVTDNSVVKTAGNPQYCMGLIGLNGIPLANSEQISNIILPSFFVHAMPFSTFASLLLADSPSTGAPQGSAFQPDIYVNINRPASDREDGLTWGTAYRSLDTAIANAAEGSIIWVAQGLYNPDIHAGAPRASTFEMKSLSLYGGFSGDGTETTLAQRDIRGNVTTLSGDLDGDDESEPYQSDNCYHVITCEKNTNVVLDGFVIEGGYTNDCAIPDLYGGDSGGGGLINKGAVVNINNCTFQNNRTPETIYHVYATVYRGGAIAGFTITEEESVYSPVTTITNSCFRFNGSDSGGAIGTSGRLVIDKCLFTENESLEGFPSYSPAYGGAIISFSNYQTDITNSVFYQNYSYDGGAIAHWGGPLLLRNCVFAQNSAMDGGASIYSTGGLQAINCTFAQNNSYYGTYSLFARSATLANCIIWEDDQISSGMNCTYSEINGGAYPGTGNRNDASPDFVNIDAPAGNDGIFGTSDDGLRLRIVPQSPCIDAGNNLVVTETTDILGDERKSNGTVDMGAYEAAPIRVSPTGGASIQTVINGAINGDVIELAPGNYEEGLIHFDGKDITIRSQDPLNMAVVETTVIDCNNKNGGFILGPGDSDVNIAGITIKNGRANMGGGISISSCNPTISNCIIINCSAYKTDATHLGLGGGLYISNASPTIKNCIISGNRTDDGLGGGIYISGGSPTLVNNVICGNYASGYNGGGIYGLSSTSSTFNVINCTVADNVGDGIVCSGSTSNAIIRNSILWHNRLDPASTEIRELVLVNSAHANVNYSNIEGGQIKVINAVPGNLIWDSGNIPPSDPQFLNWGTWKWKDNDGNEITGSTQELLTDGGNLIIYDFCKNTADIGKGNSGTAYNVEDFISRDLTYYSSLGYSIPTWHRESGWKKSTITNAGNLACWFGADTPNGGGKSQDIVVSSSNSFRQKFKWTCVNPGTAKFRFDWCDNCDEDASFFPLDGIDTLLNCNNGTDAGCGDTHNWFFTVQYHGKIKYIPGQKLYFKASDDLFVYIDNKLIVNRGGYYNHVASHPEDGPSRTTILLTDGKAFAYKIATDSIDPYDLTDLDYVRPGEFGVESTVSSTPFLTPFTEYNFDLFYANRSGCNSVLIAEHTPGGFAATPYYANDGDYHLHGHSPCVERGDNAAIVGYDKDLDSKTRVVDHPISCVYDNVAKVDMGAYECQLPIAADHEYQVGNAATYTCPADKKLLVGCTDPLNGILRAFKSTDPLHGTLTSLGEDGSFVYSKGAGTFASDSFTYYVMNSDDTCSGAKTVTLKFNNPPVAEAGDPQNITMCSTVDKIELNGSGSHDDDSTNPPAMDNDIVNYTWTWTEDEEPKQITDQNSTAFISLKDGTYTITLTVTDSAGAANSDQVQIIVQSQPVPDAVIQGDEIRTIVDNDGTIDGKIQTNLVATGNDSRTDVIYSWYDNNTWLGEGKILNNAPLNLGEHLIELLVRDGCGNFAYDDVIIEVVAAPLTDPDIDAGPAKEGTLPLSGPIILEGNVIKGDFSSYDWELISAPPGGTVYFESGKDSLTPHIQLGNVDGTYVFKLTGNITGGGTDYDTTTITINSTPGSNCAPIAEAWVNDAADSANGHNGIVSGATWDSGHSGGALNFNGIDNHVSVPNDNALNITGDITISAWVFVKGNTNQAIVTKTVSNGAFNNPFDFRIRDNSTLAFVRANASRHRYIYGSQSLSHNTWHHVVVTVSGSVGNFYIDKVLSGKSYNDPFEAPTTNSNQVLIGKRDDGLNFNGLIDDVQIYNRAITPAEVTALYDQGITFAGDENLVSRWKFDDRTLVGGTAIVNLKGKITDDGLPFGTLTGEWIRVDGLTGGVTFDPAEKDYSQINTQTTTATFTKEGTYLLGLIGNDGALTSIPSVVQVQIGSGQGPFVEAGENKFKILDGASSVDVQMSDASYIDRDTPFDNTVIQWETVPAGNTHVTFGSITNNDPKITVTFNAVGTYELKLTATDSVKGPSSDTVWVTINADDIPPSHTIEKKIYAGGSKNGNGDGAKVFCRVFGKDPSWVAISEEFDDDAVLSLCEYGGNLYAGTKGSAPGQGHIYIYDKDEGPTVWHSLVLSEPVTFVYCLAVYDDGYMYAGTEVPNKLFRFDGTSWDFVTVTGHDSGIHTLRVWKGKLYLDANKSSKQGYLDGSVWNPGP